MKNILYDVSFLKVLGKKDKQFAHSKNNNLGTLGQVVLPP